MTAKAATSESPITIGTDYDVEVGATLDGVPSPPPSILARLDRESKVWRWMAKGHIERRSMRGYETYSATDEDRTVARRDGRFRVDVENKFCWGEDAFLGVMHRQQFENRAAARRRRSQDQTAVSKDMGGLQEAARRIGSDATVRVGEKQSRSLHED